MSRKCQACGARLSSSNLGLLCFPCQEKRQEKLQEKLSDTPHYTPDDMCFLLGLQNPESVKRLGREGIIPGKVPGVRRHLYLKEQVDQWIRTGGNRADGEGRQREATKKITKVTPVSGKRDEPYQETPHKQKMRELAGTVARAIALPWVIDTFVVELKPGSVFLGRDGLPVNISETGQPKVGFEFVGHLYEELRSHLNTGGFSKVLDEIDSWKEGVADNLVKCHECLKVVKKEVEDHYDISIPTDYQGEHGFTMDFPILICADAIEQTRGSTHFRDFPYNYEGFDLRFGAFLIYRGLPNEDLKPYEDAHRELRTKYAAQEQAKEIAKQRDKLYQIQDKIRQQLQKFIDMEHLLGRCELCSHSSL